MLSYIISKMDGVKCALQSCRVGCGRRLRERAACAAGLVGGLGLGWRSSGGGFGRICGVTSAARRGEVGGWSGPIRAIFSNLMPNQLRERSMEIE
ncbi:MAG: hypothetical protein FJ387_17715 [Verrucomicrobia bacterium]|nr:hypothetical protein [Verrucomicrobiota bacterium]